LEAKMPLQEHHQIVSVDDHLVEHPRVWQDRIPAQFRDEAPRIKEVNGMHLWHYDGQVFPTIGLNAVAGKPRDQWGLDPVRYEDMIPGCYDPAARVKDMDLDGEQAALCFPSFPGFGGGTFFRASDKKLAALCVQAWNDFYIDEWCGTAPGRFIPLAILPVWDIDLCVAEARRAIEKGARTISFPDSPVPLGLPSFHTDHWDRVFAVAEEAGMPLSMHFGSSGKAPSTADDAPFAVAISLFGCNSMYTTADLLFSPVFHKFPGLKVALSEGGIGWIPYMLERLDYTWERHKYYTGVNQEVRPSDLFRRHIWGCFIDDEFGIANRHWIGVDRITWECDYPHSDSNWPLARKRAAETLADVPDDEVHQIVELNARKLFRFDG